MRFKVRNHRNTLVLLLETFPPLFHLLLLGSLSYLAVHLNPEDTRWFIATIFLDFHIVANWIAFGLNQSVIRNSPKNYPGYQHRYPSLTSSKDERTSDDTYLIKRSYDSWRECDYCDMHVPPRAHHCSHCRRCVYVLDHHCYFLGFCAGRTNLRFFIVFCLYAGIGSAVGVYNLITTMSYYRDLKDTSQLPYYILPFTVIKYFHQRQAELFEVFYVALINFGAGSALACFFLMGRGLHSAFTGLSPYEERKKAEKHILRLEEVEADESIAAKFYEVFGPCGIMHFLIPVVPFAGPRPAPTGYRRIITYNHDFVHDGNVYTAETNLDFEA